ncbi:hypothetical protein MJ579_19825 [Klebsiella pneumoniae]|nr:hypothetical protein MJ579_19825 [Klebsiella pneumoniae]
MVQAELLMRQANGAGGDFFKSLKGRLACKAGTLRPICIIDPCKGPLMLEVLSILQPALHHGKVNNIAIWCILALSMESTAASFDTRTTKRMGDFVRCPDIVCRVSLTALSMTARLKMVGPGAALGVN